jgi:5'-phosphate synthase pdxT subunit
MAADAKKKRVGVLALQGDFQAHERALTRAGAEVVEVRTASDLEGVDGLVIPGGESSTMIKLLEEEKLLDPLRAFGRERPIFGTCAGAILLSTGITNSQQASLGLMDMEVERNAYGRQLDSRIARLKPEGMEGELEAVFIRAPIIRSVGQDAKILASYQGDPVLVEQGRHLAATFHPELTDDSRVHLMFLRKIP